MFLYRLCNAAYAKDMNATGAKIFGGRWNHKGTACIYTAESRALSLLEYSVHVIVETIPNKLSFVTFTVPDNAVFKVAVNKLPSNWQQWPHTKESRDYGTALLKRSEYMILQFPSVIIPEEFIYIINPLHSRMKEVKISNVSKFVFDERIKS